MKKTKSTSKTEKREALNKGLLGVRISARTVSKFDEKITIPRTRDKLKILFLELVNELNTIFLRTQSLETITKLAYKAMYGKEPVKGGDIAPYVVMFEAIQKRPLQAIELTKLIGAELGAYEIPPSGNGESLLTKLLSDSASRKPSLDERLKLVQEYRTSEGHLDVRSIREDFCMTQKEFSVNFGIRIDTLQSWEQGINKPKGPAETLLVTIILEPNMVRETAAIYNALMKQSLS